MKRAESLPGWVPAVIVGGILRAWGISFGLPRDFLRPDEDYVVSSTLGMLGGNLDPHDYTYPTLFKYLLLAVFQVGRLFGAGYSAADSAWQAAAHGLLVDPSDYFLMARLLSAVFGILTIYLTYRIALACFGARAAWIASGLLAVAPLHVRDSHFGVTDIAATAMVCAALWASILVATHGRRRYYLLAGLLVGLSASTKYSVALSIVALAAAYLFARRQGRSDDAPRHDLSAALAGALAALSFAATSPYLLINLPGFWRDFGYQLGHLFVRGHGADVGFGWVYYLSTSLPYGLGILPALASVTGIIQTVRRRSMPGIVLLSFVFCFYVLFGASQTVFFRYVLPLLPPLCCFAGAGLADILNRVGPARRSLVMALVGAMVVGQPLYASARIVGLLASEDTRTLAREWLERNVPSGSVIVNAGGLFGDVQLPYERHDWWVRRFIRSYPEVSGDALVQLLERPASALPPRLVYTHYPGDPHFEEREHGRLADLRAFPGSYAIAHSHPLYYSTVDSSFIALLQLAGSEVVSFSPGPEGELERAVFDVQDAFYIPFWGFGDLERPGPGIRIWRLKGRSRFASGDFDIRTSMYHTFNAIARGEYLLGRLGTAEEYYRRSADLGLPHPAPHIALAEISAAQGRLAKAGEAIDAALALDPGNARAKAVLKALENPGQGSP